MKIPRTLILGSAFLLAFSLSTTAPGQDQKKPITFGTEVIVVAVPVFVTDKDGKTVAGLTAQDFEIEDGGKPAPVEGFLAVSGDGDLGVPVDSVSNLNQLTARRQFVLLFDLALTRAVAIERARVAARKFIETEVRPRDLVSVVAATPQGMKVIGMDALDLFRIEGGFIIGGVEYDPTVSPYECALGWSVDLEKGDFQGREGIVRDRDATTLRLGSVVLDSGGAAASGAPLLVDGV